MQLRLVVTVGSLPPRRDSDRVRAAITDAFSNRSWISLRFLDDDLEWAHLTSSSFVVCEISGRHRALPLAQLGFARGADRPALALVRRGTVEPPDLPDVPILRYRSPSDLQRQLADVDLVQPEVLAQLRRPGGGEGPGCEPRLVLEVAELLLRHGRLDPRLVFDTFGARDVSELQVHMTVELLEGLGWVRTETPTVWLLSAEGRAHLHQLRARWSQLGPAMRKRQENPPEPAIS